MQTSGDFYNGKRSERHAVTLAIRGEYLQITGKGIELSWPLKEVRISPPLGSMKRSVYLPDGGKCDFDDNAFAKLAEQRQGKSGFFNGVHRWENSLKLAFTALIITITFVLGFIQFGIPVLSEQAAYAIPPSTEITIGQET